MTAEEPDRGRADLHVHTLASDGTASVADILDALAAGRTLDVVAIADHERIDAAQAARHIALDRGLPVEIVVGEEITTRGGHLLGLFLERRVPPLKSLRWSIEAVHDQGGIAIPAHPLVPLHLSAQGWVLRALLTDDNPLVHPDAIETFNPTAIGRYGHARAVAFAAGARPAADRQQRRPCPRGDRQRVDGLPGPDRGRPAPGDPVPATRRTTGRSTARWGSSGCSGASCASAAATPATR